MGPKIMIAGPCSVESEEQIMNVAKFLKSMGVEYLRGGAFKPRTSPKSFQGLGKEGIDLLIKAREKYGLKIVTEIMDTRDIELFKDVDIVQMGSRNMQNFSLLKEVNKLKCTVLFKRHFGATIKEWIAASDYLCDCEVIFCARGIRTFETETRNTADIDAIPILKDKGFKVIFDPSHSAGRKDLILPLSKAAIAAGADGLMIEVHPNPEDALSDKEQQLDLDEFKDFLKELNL